MTKNEFIHELNELLYVLPQSEKKRSIDYYSEMIDDRIEDGESEDEATAKIGNPKAIAADIISNIPLYDTIKTEINNMRKKNTLLIFLAVMASPIWLSLLIVLFAAALSVYISLWSIALSIIAATVGIVCGAAGGIIISVIMAVTEPIQDALFIFGCSLILAGISVFLFYAIKYILIMLIRFTVWLIKKSKFMIIRNICKGAQP